MRCARFHRTSTDTGEFHRLCDCCVGSGTTGHDQENNGGSGQQQRTVSHDHRYHPGFGHTYGGHTGHKEDQSERHGNQMLLRQCHLPWFHGTSTDTGEFH